MSTITPPLHLWKWIKKHAGSLKPPVSNKQLYVESPDAIVFVSGGPNTRNDYHVNPTEELFYQLKGDVAVRLRPLDGSKPYDQVIREGEMFLLPRWVPHRPQRPANTVGLIIEFPRGLDAEGNPQKDGLQWYCPKCDTLVHDARFVLKKIDEDLAVVMNDFWDGPADRRTCKGCGHVIERAGTIQIKGGKVKPGGVKKASKAPTKKAPAKKKVPGRTAAGRKSRGTRGGTPRRAGSRR